MIDIPKMLYEICEDENVYNPEFDLIENGVLDSLAMIELFSKFEELGLDMQPTRIDRNRLRTPRSIEELVNEYTKSKE